MSDEKRSEYFSQKTTDGKNMISSSVVKQVRANGGRFLKKNDAGKWDGIGDEGAAAKTAQLFRDLKSKRKNIVRDSQFEKKRKASPVKTMQCSARYPSDSSAAGISLAHATPIIDSDFLDYGNPVAHATPVDVLIPEINENDKGAKLVAGLIHEIEEDDEGAKLVASLVWQLETKQKWKL